MRELKKSDLLNEISIEKSKYIKREGTPGHYKYYYKNADGSVSVRGDKGSTKSSGKKKSHENENQPKKTDWYSAYISSWNRFTLGGKEKPSFYNGKSKKEVQSGSSTDLGGLFDGVNDFVFDATQASEKQIQNFKNRLQKLGFHEDSVYDRDGKLEYALMVRDGSKSNNVTLNVVDNDSMTGNKTFEVKTFDDSGNIVDVQQFKGKSPDKAWEYLDSQRNKIQTKSTPKASGKMPTGYVASLSADTKTKLKAAIENHFKENGISGDDLADAVDNAMDSKVSDLEELYNSNPKIKNILMSSGSVEKSSINKSFDLGRSSFRSF